MQLLHAAYSSHPISLLIENPNRLEVLPARRKRKQEKLSIFHNPATTLGFVPLPSGGISFLTAMITAILGCSARVELELEPGSPKQRLGLLLAREGLIYLELNEFAPRR